MKLNGRTERPQPDDYHQAVIQIDNDLKANNIKIEEYIDALIAHGEVI